MTTAAITERLAEDRTSAAIGSVALEGLQVDSDERAVIVEVAAGRLDADAAVAMLLARVRAGFAR